jgi:hypothetical protein
MDNVQLLDVLSLCCGQTFDFVMVLAMLILRGCARQLRLDEQVWLVAIRAAQVEPEGSWQVDDSAQVNQYCGRAAGHLLAPCAGISLRAVVSAKVFSLALLASHTGK